MTKAFYNTDFTNPFPTFLIIEYKCRLSSSSSSTDSSDTDSDSNTSSSSSSSSSLDSDDLDDEPKWIRKMDGLNE